MRRIFRRWLGFFRRPVAKKPVAEALSAPAMAEALALARFLYAEGARARELEPGEEPSEAPEVGAEAL